MGDWADYGMFTDEGNMRVDDVLADLIPEAGRPFGAGVHAGTVRSTEVDADGILVVHLTDGRRSLRDLFDLAVERLEALALDSAFAEATDTVVRDAVSEEIRLRFLPTTTTS